MVNEPVTKFKLGGMESSEKPRLYVMTTDNIYLFKNENLSRRYKIKDVGAVMQSIETNLFMIFFERSEDLIISSPNRNDILALLKLRFNCLERDVTLRCYGVSNKEISQMAQTNNL